VRQRYSDADVAEVSRLCALRGVFGADAPPKKVREHVESLSDFALHALCSDSRLGGALLHKRLPSDAALDSGKARFLAELLPALAAKGSRPLIFSQWKIMLDVLEWTLAELGLKFFRLDGSTPVEERQALVDAYNAPDSTCFAFLLSTRAGGQGINLTGADTVILHDCDFNPQIDRQAEDRSHRLGQTRPVTVYRLVTQDTVDAKIVAIAERKLTLDAAVLSANDDEAGAPAEEGMIDAKASRQAEARSMAALLQGLLAEGAASEAQAASDQAVPAVVIRDTKDD
jgi:SWI/SNF-related matrix-associated actin-dependent regulator 1 of chromatin subfamily A